MEKNPTVVVEQPEVQDAKVELSNQAERPDLDAQDSEIPLILDELVIEEVNIDGMCGVY